LRFALAVIGAAVVQIFPYVYPNTPALLAIAYLLFAALGAGFFAGRRAPLAGALSVLLGAALYGIWSNVSLRVEGGTTFLDFLTAETSLLVGVVPYAVGGAVAGAIGGALRGRVVARAR
jgi:hypothetical protein